MEESGKCFITLLGISSHLFCQWALRTKMCSSFTVCQTFARTVRWCSQWESMHGGPWSLCALTGLSVLWWKLGRLFSSIRSRYPNCWGDVDLVHGKAVWFPFTFQLTANLWAQPTITSCPPCGAPRGCARHISPPSFLSKVTHLFLIWKPQLLLPLSGWM